MKHKLYIGIILLVTIRIVPLSAETYAAPFTLINSYYRVLALQEAVQSPSLNYHTLATLQYDIPAQAGPWGASFFSTKDLLAASSMSLTVFPVQAWTSYNAHHASGGNDGNVWQGKGVNAFITAGAQFAWKGLAVTLLPEQWVAQNEAFDLVPADASHNSEYAYFTPAIDLPQRFGNKVIIKPSLGQSEIRYTWRTLTIGLGTQSVWLGPTQRNAVILSNNAGGFPKLDLGLKRTETKIGAFEAFLWFGRTTASDYLKDKDVDKHQFFSGGSVSYAPSFIPGLTLGVNRVVLSQWKEVELNTVTTLFFMNATAFRYGRDAIDQRFSLTFEWMFSSVGFSVYGEWGRNDRNSLRHLLITPEHTQGYTIGLRQAIRNRRNSNFWLINVELTDLIQSRDYEINLLGTSNTGFYTHGFTKHGHTHQGQSLGAFIDTGADAQYLSASWYYKKGVIGGFLQRISYNKDYIYGSPTLALGDVDKLNVSIEYGLYATLHISSHMTFTIEMSIQNRLNWNYQIRKDVVNVYGLIGAAYRF